MQGYLAGQLYRCADMVAPILVGMTFLHKHKLEIDLANNKLRHIPSGKVIPLVEPD
jgi:hypothetical protein